VPACLSTPYNGRCDMTKKIIKTTRVQMAFSRKDTSLSGVLTSGITRTNGDNAFRNIDGKDPLSPAGFCGRFAESL